jgi:hypothetical protein
VSARVSLRLVNFGHSEGLLLLTATPHDGYGPHFVSLIELLDPSLVDGRGGLAGTLYRRHVVRRLKSHIRDPATEAPLFRERRVVPVRVELTDAGAAPSAHFIMHWRHSSPRGCGGRPMRAKHADALAFVSLLKRLGSTVRACLSTLGVVAEVDVTQLEIDSMAADLRVYAATGPVWRGRTREVDATIEAPDELILLGEAAEPCDRSWISCCNARSAFHSCGTTDGQHPDLHRVCRQPVGCAIWFARCEWDWR